MTYFAYMSLYLRIKWFQTVVTNIKIKWQFSLSNAGKLFLSVLREHLCENEHLNWDLNANKSSMGRAQRECIPDILCERTNNINSSKKNLWVYVCVCVYIYPHISIYIKNPIYQKSMEIYISLSFKYWVSTICQPFYKSLRDGMNSKHNWVSRSLLPSWISHSEGEKETNKNSQGMNKITTECGKSQGTTLPQRRGSAKVKNSDAVTIYLVGESWDWFTYFCRKM